MNKEITNLKIENLKEFKGHPFKVVDDWDMVAYQGPLQTWYERREELLP